MHLILGVKKKILYILIYHFTQHFPFLIILSILIIYIIYMYVSCDYTDKVKPY